MNVKKAIKRIGAIAAGATMVTATIMGAMAYDLSDYPAPFIENGVFTGKIVIGKAAKVSDVFGAIDIAASLQAAAKTPVEVEGSSETVTVTGGVEIKSGSDDLNFGDELDDFNQGKYDSDDFPDLLADGTLEDDDGTDYDYEQYIYVGDAAVSYGQDDDEGGDDPVFYIGLGDADIASLNFSVEFDNSVNVTELTDSESIEMFGKKYTFDPNHDLNDDLTLYGSDVTVTVTQDEPVTIEVDGQEYTIEVLGGNSDGSTAIVRVTGDTTETKTLEQGDSKKIAGLDLFVDDVFISNIGANTVSVSLFVGSNKIVIPSSAVSSTPSWKEIEVNGDDDTDIYAWVESSTGDLGAVDGLHFYIDPTDFDNPRTGDNWDWLIAGERWTDPLFGFSLYFDGYTPMKEDRNLVEFKRSGDGYVLEFTNNDGDEYSFEIYQSPSTSVELGKDLVLSGGNTAGTALEDGDVFILEEDSTNRDDAVTKVYEVRDIDDDNDKITLRELGSGVTKDYDAGDEIDDTGVTVGTVNPSNFTLSSAVLNYIVFKGGSNLTLDTSLGDGANLTYHEDEEDLDDVSTADTLSFAIVHDSDEDIAMTNADWAASGAVEVSDSNGDVRYGVSLFGTMFEQEIDNSGDYLKIYYSEEETDFHVFLEGPEAVVVKTGGSSGGTYYQINPMVVGQIAVYDDEALGMLGSTPLIVVGGPCVNTVAMELMGNPETCTEGFVQGKGKIKLFSSKNALLVAGYTGEDTVGASYVLADYDNYDLSGDEVEVIVTDLENLQVQSVA